MRYHFPQPFNQGVNTMRRRATFPTLILSILAAIAASTQSSSAIAPDHGPSASGQGEFLFLNPGPEQWSYSFEVVANKNGHASGRAIFDILENSTPTQVIVKINCIDVIESSGSLSASMTGTVLHSDNPEFPKRATVLFGAVDSSGAPTPSSDIITRLFVFEGGDCHSGAFPLTFFLQSPDAIHIEP
jgi:hypothetical protein